MTTPNEGKRGTTTARFVRKKTRKAPQQRGQQELASFLGEQLSLAHQNMLMGAPVVEIDTATRFARQIRQRRRIV